MNVAESIEFVAQAHESKIKSLNFGR